MKHLNSFNSQAQLKVGKDTFTIWRLDALEKAGLPVARLPFSLKILLENMLRMEDDTDEFAGDIEALARWVPREASDREINFTPARVLLQDFTGVPAVVDLAAMRDAMVRLGGDPTRINPLSPAELVIDHSVQVDEFGTRVAFRRNVELEYERNRERYTFLRWGQGAFRNFRVVPPGTGIVHQVNVEYLARVIFRTDDEGNPCAYPDTLVGTDSHTTMVNGLGVLGWGVGGIEAEAAMLGQPVAMLIPQVVGFKFTGELPEGATATDLVLTVTEMLRKKGVVGKFVEFYGPGLAHLNVADRATIGNMAPEYGATCGIFPIDQKTLAYLEFTGRPKEHLALVEAYAKEQGLWHTDKTPEAEYSDTLHLDLSTVEPSVAGPRRPQDRIPLSQVKSSFVQTMQMAGAAAGQTVASGATTETSVPVTYDGNRFDLRDGAVVIAAITSCTNTSNPSVMIAAGLVAQKAHALGLTRKPWVKTSLAPGSKVVMDYYEAAGLVEPLEALGFNLVGFGCTTCIGNSGPLPEEISEAVDKGGLVVASVLSGNRNFEGRINPDVRANYLASPPLVVAYALAGRVDLDLYNEPIGQDQKGRSVFLRDIWPTLDEIQKVIDKAVRPEMFRAQYAHVFEGDDLWRNLPTPTGDIFAWEADSTYVKNPPYFEDMPRTPTAVADIKGARILAILGDSITTDHISPAGSIKANSPAGKYLQEHGVAPKDFNSYGSRRGNHEVMMRGTFANIRLRNKITPDVEGGFTKHWPDGEVMSIYDASMKYQADEIGTVILAGKEYGTGSSRDWAAKGPRLLGVRAVIAESFERIHRSNLIGMGVLPLQFAPGQNAETLGFKGTETIEIVNVAGALAKPGSEVTVLADGKAFTVKSRIDTPQEAEYFRHGGILQYVLRQLAGLA
ncbi:MAG TPA: aconitate hydratase AcnA [Longimicrobiales bacterium]